MEEFMGKVAVALSNDDLPLLARKNAAIILKENICPFVMNIVTESQMKTKDMIKELLMKNLGSSIFSVRYNSAQIISMIVSKEDESSASEIIIKLIKNMSVSHDQINDGSMMALCACCEEVKPSNVNDKLMERMTHLICESVSRVGYSDNIRACAAKSLYKAFGFVRTENLKSLILTHLLEAADWNSGSKEAIKIAALDSMVIIGCSYDRILEDQVDALLDFTENLVMKSGKHLGRLSIEFWRGVCLAETEAKNSGKPIYHLIERAMPRLIRILQHASLDEIMSATSKDSLELINGLVKLLSGNKEEMRRD